MNGSTGDRMVSVERQNLPLLAGTRWLIAIVAIGTCLLAAFWDSLGAMWQVWMQREEYSHGVLMPLIAAFLIWQRRAEIAATPFEPSWSGVFVVLAGMTLALVGHIASLFVLQQYALVLVLLGLALSCMGSKMQKLLWPPLLILFLMVPLPYFLLNNLSSQLQLISSQVGVALIRLFDISVFVEGNVIDLGGYQLQVAEACDGLRYLFPLMTLGFIMAYMFKAAMWKRVVLFLSAIPVTILMNSARIGIIGVMVEHWGIEMAEGFLHEFQGWAVFMISAAVLLLEIMLLARIGRDRRPWREAFGMHPVVVPAGAIPLSARDVAPPFIVSTVVLAVFCAGILLLPNRAEAIPQREPLLAFPGQIERWTGRRDVMEQIYLDTLKLDDYVIADFVRGDRELVNFYVAWYDSQRAGQSAHSPRSCLPGGGWRITSLEQVDVGSVHVGTQPLQVNRVQIELGNNKQVVYYWFQQRGRVITNEYLVKWYLFWDSLTRRRTDGALVRLVTPLRAGEGIEAADRRLADFAADVAPRLERYIPD